jgi:hypothetical protein
MPTPNWIILRLLSSTNWSEATTKPSGSLRGRLHLWPPCLFVFGSTAPSGPGPPHSRGFWITHNGAPHSVGLRLDEWSARRRDLYLTTHNTHNRQTSMPPMRFEPTISAGERLQTYVLDRAATGIGFDHLSNHLFTCKSLFPQTVAVISAPCFTARRRIKATRYTNIRVECPSAGAIELDRSPHVLLSTFSSHSNLTIITVTSHSSSVTRHSLRTHGTLKALFVNVRRCCMIHDFEVS